MYIPEQEEGRNTRRRRMKDRRKWKVKVE